MKALYETMEQSGSESVKQSDIELNDVVLTRYADMRYVGQEHAVTVELPLALFTAEDRAGIKRHFDDVHAQRYGFSSPEEKAEIVSLRSAVSGILPKPPFEKIEAGGAQPKAEASAGDRPVYFGEARGFVRTPVFSRWGAGRGQCDCRTGADRGARFHHSRPSGRPAGGRCLWQSRDRYSEELR